MGLPPTFSKTLGREYVCGLNLDPTPATGIIALIYFPKYFDIE
jgi:hypothetical protein